jgi:hypothetical protein
MDTQSKAPKPQSAWPIAMHRSNEQFATGSRRAFTRPVRIA